MQNTVHGMNQSCTSVIIILCFCSLFLNNYLKPEGGYCFNALSTLIQTLLTPVGTTRHVMRMLLSEA